MEFCDFKKNRSKISSSPNHWVFSILSTDERFLQQLKRAQIPDQLWLGMHISHAILGKSLVQAVEGGSKKASYNPHQNEEAQVHSCPEVAFLVRLRALCAEKD